MENKPYAIAVRIYESNGVTMADIKTWHGMYCSCSDGATPSNYIIPAIVDCDNELDWKDE